MRKLVCVVLTIGLLLAFSACAKKSTSDTQYYSTPMDALSYVSYINMELSTTLNALETHMGNAMLVASGDYPRTDEADKVGYTLTMLETSISTVEKIAPTNKYEDNREEVLRCMANARDTLTAYKDALENGDDIDSYIQLMEGDFSALNALFTMPIE